MYNYVLVIQKPTHQGSGTHCDYVDMITHTTQIQDYPVHTD